MPDTSRHPNHRPVTIHRAGSILSRAQGPEVDDFFADSKQGVGSYFDSLNSNKVGNGLTDKEEELLVPRVVDLKYDDRDFRKKMTEFYSDINTPVPFKNGVTLETGLTTDNDKEVSKDNLPLNVMDYLRWKHALGHPWVAANKDKADGDQTKVFYIFDKAALQAGKTDRGKELDAANMIFLKIKENEDTVSQLLALMGTDPGTFLGKNAPELRVEALREYVHKKPKEFTKVYNDGDIEIRYWIKAMAQYNVLKQVGARFIDPETDKPLASSDEEMIYWFKDEEHSDKVVTLKARLQEAIAAAPKTEKRRTRVN